MNTVTQQTNKQCARIVTLTLATLLVAPAAGRADVLYVSNSGSGDIAGFDSATGTEVSVWPTTFNALQGLALDNAGNLYAADYAGFGIDRFTSGGVGSLFATGLQNVTGLACDSAGNLYAAAYFINFAYGIEKLTPTGVGSIFAADGGLFGNQPEGLAFDRADNLYVAMSGGTILKVTPSGIGAIFASGLNGAPRGLAFDSAGNLYVTLANNSVEKFTPNGVSSVFASSGLNSPYGLAFDSAGNLYVANSGNNTIEKYSSTGTDLGVFASSSLNRPEFIAIQQVPEPSAWVLLGFGLTAMVAFRGRILSLRSSPRKFAHGCGDSATAR